LYGSHIKSGGEIKIYSVLLNDSDLEADNNTATVSESARGDYAPFIIFCGSFVNKFTRKDAG